MSEPVVRTGAIAVLRFYDVAYSIDLARAEALAAPPVGVEGVSRRQLASTEPKAVAFGTPPVTDRACKMAPEARGGRGRQESKAAVEGGRGRGGAERGEVG